MKYFFIFVIAVFCLVSDASAGLYYSDQENPPVTEREPPYDITRKQTENGKYYLNIRYPYENEKGIVFLLSMGNELENLMFYQIKKLELKYQGKSLELTPVFYNYTSKREARGIDALVKYRHPMPPNLHRRVEVICETCQPDMKELQLDLEVTVYYDDTIETLQDSIKLYQGTFT